ncbi:MAG: tRNA (adenosine(37)-N6)-threonylcarbamoyltransferase complex dimerization subunit type 1 TsaB [Fuerstiella sp.]
MSDQQQIVLAIETSGVEGDLAVCTADGSVFESRIGIDGRRHAQTLVAETGALLETAGIRPSEISVVAVSNGPGSFTGLRVGTVFAKTLAWANNARLVDVDSLQTVACAAKPSQSIVTAISDAQRSEVFVNRYSAPDEFGIRHALDELSIVSVERLNQQFSTGHHGILTGAAVGKFAKQLQNCAVTESSVWLPQARWVQAIGRQRAVQKRFADIATLEPVYVRRSYAEEKVDSQND